MEKIVGIYKVTSPSGKIYIGQTKDYRRRAKNYRSRGCYGQPKLHNSFKKYGFDNHIMELVCECDVNMLNTLERFYQEKYDVIGEMGLNCELVGTDNGKKVLSEYSYNKIKKRFADEEFRKKWKESNTAKRVVLDTQTGVYYNSATELCDLYGFNFAVMIGRLSGKYYNDTQFRYADDDGIVPVKKKRTKCFTFNFKLSTKYRMSEYHRERIAESTRKIILDTQTGVYYNSFTELMNLYGFKMSTIGMKLTGKKKNNTPFIYV